MRSFGVYATDGFASGSVLGRTILVVPNFGVFLKNPFGDVGPCKGFISQRVQVPKI